MTGFRQKQSGVALMVVLLAFALASIFTIGMMSRQNLMIQGTGHYITQSETQSLAMGAELFARQILYRDWESDSNDDAFVDDGEETWARYSVALPVDFGSIEAQINDLQGRLNLNDLVDARGEPNEKMQERVNRLLEVLDIRSVTVEAIIDWIDPDDQRTGPGGAEDGEYLMQDPPYRAANRPMAQISELRLLDGITQEDYRRLRPHVTALPVQGQSLNVNFASAPVIQSLDERITAPDAENIVNARQEERFATVDDFIARQEFAGMGMTGEGLDVRTFYFEVASRVTIGNNVYHLVSQLYRSPEGEISAISRDAGQTGIITKEVIETP